MKMPASLAKLLPASPVSFDDLAARLGRFPDKKRRAAEAGAVAAVALLYFVLWAQPNVATLDALNADLARASQNVAEKEAFAKHFGAYTRELEANRARLTSAHELLPDDPGIPAFLARLGSMANGLDVTILRLEPTEEVDKEFYAEIGLRVAVRGSFHQVATLIDQIGSQPRIVNVLNLRLFDPKPSQQKILVDGQFDVKIFRFLSEEQMAAQKAKGKAP